MDPEVVEAFEQVKKHLERNKCQLIEVDLSEIEKIDKQMGLESIFYEITGALSAYLKENNVGMTFDEIVESIASPDVRNLFNTRIVANAPNKISDEKYNEIVNDLRPKLIDASKRLFRDIDLLVYPALVCLAPSFDQITTNPTKTLGRMVAATCLSTNNGMPSLSIPVAKNTDKNLHIGLLLEADLNRDQFLLKCGALIHQLFKTPLLIKSK